MTLLLYKHITSKPDDIETNIMAANISTRFFYHVAIKDLLLSNKSVELPENVLISEGGK